MQPAKTHPPRSARLAYSTPEKHQPPELPTRIETLTNTQPPRFLSIFGTPMDMSWITQLRLIPLPDQTCFRAKPFYLSLLTLCQPHA